MKICNSNQIRRILVRAPNWIGDAVLCLPALERLKSAYPQADMTVLAKPWVSPVFSHNPAIKRIIEYDTSVRHRGIYGKWRLVQVIRGYGFDMAVLFQNAFEAALIAFLSRIPVRIGYNRDGRRLLLTYPVELTSDIKRAHHVAYYLNIIDRIQKPEYRTQNKNISQLDKENRPKLYLTEKEKDWSKGFLNDKGIDSGIIIGIAPGASYGPAKRWMAERFRGVAQRLIEAYGARLILFGEKFDRDICGEVLNSLDDKKPSKGINVHTFPLSSPLLGTDLKSVPTGGQGENVWVNLAGEISLRESIAILSRCNLFITNDSGPMHIAAALGVPTVAIFGSTDPSLTGPIGDTVKVLKKDISCSPCFERECKKGHYDCMNMITVDDVYEACVAFLGRKGMGVQNF